MTSWIPEFRQEILTEGKALYRDMPWRYLDDAYGVLVSEVMLQQTQVSRVIQRWGSWMKRFPTVDALAAADRASVLEEWQGLGYNRRALNLKVACETCSRDFAGQLPGCEDDLLALPGVGPSTAAGVMAFAYDEPAVYLETNVRAVFIHRFFPEETKVPDKVLVPLVREACPEQDVRTWYYALLDCGAHLKASLGRLADPSRRSSAYQRQSAFEGSHRQKRAELLRIVLVTPGISREDAFAALVAQEVRAGREEPAMGEVATIVEELIREGFLTCENDRLRP